MPNPNDKKNSKSGCGKSNQAAFGWGAVTGGALVALATWFFSREDVSERPHNFEHHYQYQPNHPMHQAPQAPNSDTDENNDDDDTVNSCEICFRDFKNLKGRREPIVTTPCGHVYCRKCLVTALEIKPECPTCRRRVQVNNLTRLYL